MEPIIDILTLEELQALAAREVMRRNGIDPVAKVRHVAALRLDAGVMAVTIIDASPEMAPVDLTVKK